MKNLILILLIIYSKGISPYLRHLFGHACRFEVTCSENAINEIRKNGIIRGGKNACIRLLKCNPFTPYEVIRN